MIVRKLAERWVGVGTFFEMSERSHSSITHSVRLFWRPSSVNFVHFCCSPHRVRNRADRRGHPCPTIVLSKLPGCKTGSGHSGMIHLRYFFLRDGSEDAVTVRDSLER